MFKLKRVSEKDQYKNLVDHPLQTYEWGEFRRKTGNQVARFSVYKNNKRVTDLQILIHNLPFSKYKVASLIKCPPLNEEVLINIKKFAKENRIIFIKIEPNVIVSIKNSKNNLSADNSSLMYKESKPFIDLLKRFGGVRGKTLFTPSTYIIDLSDSEDDLLKNFNSKTRYNIRYSLRKGVKVKEENSKQAFEKYLKLMRQTVKRQRFYAHSEKYHRLMWEYLHELPKARKKSPIARLFVAKYKNKIITTWILFVWKDTLYYPYGASSNIHKNVMANNLMMWEAIRFGKRNDLKYFDLWGIEEGKGFTRFKKGYSPLVANFVGTWDLKIYNNLYLVYKLLNYLRWKILKIKAKFIKPYF